MLSLRWIPRPLTGELIESNYRRGYFPMGDASSDTVTWHCPRRRAVIPLEAFHISRSLDRLLRQARFTVSFNRAFDAVVAACADRPANESTWITPEIMRAYGDLHRMGKAGSVEVWIGDQLSGGLYGVHLGGAFFAESKFHRVRDMSKVALAHLVFRLRERGFSLLEVQYLTPHLARFGAVEITQREYQARLQSALALDCTFD